MKLSRKLLVSTLSLSLLSFLPLVGPHFSSQAAEIASTYTACYFRSGNTETWRWGLQPDNNWYEMAGTWENRRHTGTTYFNPSSASSTAIIQSCIASRNYYELTGYELIGVYAADSAAGSNYSIRVDSGNKIDGVEVLP